MTDFSPEQDELASAYIDGEVSADERAMVDADPALLARVAELRSVRETLAEPTASPTEAERDAVISAALRSANVVDIRVAQGHRRLRIASIAAAILVVLGAAGLLLRAAGDHTNTKFEAVAGSIGSASDTSAEAGQATRAAAAPNPATGAFSVTGRPDLGSFTDRSALTAAAQSQVHNPALTQQKGASTVPPSADAAGGTGAGGGTAPTCLVPAPPAAVNEVYAATAILQGRTVQIDVFTIADGSLTLVVTDAATCTEDFTQSV